MERSGHIIVNNFAIFAFSAIIHGAFDDVAGFFQTIYLVTLMKHYDADS